MLTLEENMHLAFLNLKHTEESKHSCAEGIPVSGGDVPGSVGKWLVYLLPPTMLLMAHRFFCTVGLREFICLCRIQMNHKGILEGEN